MPRPEPGETITTQLGRVVYDRKPKKFTLRDGIRIGKRIKWRFFLIPGVLWLDFIDRILGTEFADALGSRPLLQVKTKSSMVENNPEELLELADASAVVFVKGDPESGSNLL